MCWGMPAAHPALADSVPAAVRASGSVGEKGGTGDIHVSRIPVAPATTEFWPGGRCLSPAREWSACPGTDKTPEEPPVRLVKCRPARITSRPGPPTFVFYRDRSSPLRSVEPTAMELLSFSSHEKLNVCETTWNRRDPTLNFHDRLLSTSTNHVSVLVRLNIETVSAFALHLSGRLLTGCHTYHQNCPVCSKLGQHLLFAEAPRESTLPNTVAATMEKRHPVESQPLMGSNTDLPDVEKPPNNQSQSKNQRWHILLGVAIGIAYGCSLTMLSSSKTEQHKGSQPTLSGFPVASEINALVPECLY